MSGIAYKCVSRSTGWVQTCSKVNNLDGKQHTSHEIPDAASKQETQNARTHEQHFNADLEIFITEQMTGISFKVFAPLLAVRNQTGM